MIIAAVTICSCFIARFNKISRAIRRAETTNRTTGATNNNNVSSSIELNTMSSTPGSQTIPTQQPQESQYFYPPQYNSGNNNSSSSPPPPPPFATLPHTPTPIGFYPADTMDYPCNAYSDFDDAVKTKEKQTGEGSDLHREEPPRYNELFRNA